MEQILNRIVETFGPVNLVLSGVCLMLYKEWRRERSERDQDRALFAKTVLHLSRDFREAIHRWMTS